MFPRFNLQYRNYIETLFPLLVESVLIGVLVNLVSTYAERWLSQNQIPFDGKTASLILFLLLAIIALYTLFQSRVRRDDFFDPQKPNELGSMLSLVFFAQLLFLDCSQLLEFNRWLLLGVGATPFLLGTGMTGYLDIKHHEWKQKIDQMARERLSAEAEKQTDDVSEQKQEKYPEPPARRNPSERATELRPSRIHMRAVLHKDLDVEQQPGILFVIIESILAVKKNVSQMEIFEVCRAITKKMPPVNIFDLIRELMISFVDIRQSTRQVELNTENPKEWKIVETHPRWMKNESS